jgi:hypothetical protein
MCVAVLHLKVFIDQYMEEQKCIARRTVNFCDQTGDRILRGAVDQSIVTMDAVLGD